MEQFAVSFLFTSLAMSVIILAVLLFNALCGKVLPAKSRYAVWLIILVGLLIPIRPSIGRGVFTVPINVTESNVASGTFALSPENSVSPIAERSVSPFTVGVIVWGVVALAVFVYHMWRYFRFIKTVNRWGVAVKDEKILSVLQNIQEEMGLRDKNVDLKICGFVSSSMLTGFSRPMILLPEKSFESDELELIFKHELIHYKRRDLYVKLLSVAAVALHWFNPIVYQMSAAMQADGEASCDEAVLPDAETGDRHFYAEVIIGMIGGGGKQGTVLSTCFYGGKASIKRRLESILDTTRKMKHLAVLVLAAAAAMTLFSGSVFAFGNAENIAVTQTETTELILEQAIEIALAFVGGGTVTEFEMEFENGRKEYEITIVYEGNEYELEIDAATGEITEFSMEAIRDGR